MKFLALALLLGVALANQVKYDNYTVFRVFPENYADVEALQKLQENVAYDFWTDGVGINNPVDVMVSPEMNLEFQSYLISNNLKSEVYIENVQQKIDGERAPSHPRAMGWADYYDLDEIYGWLDELGERFPDIVTVIAPGGSFEGREVKGLHISFKPENAENVVYVEGGIHAREWISSAVVTYSINEILTSEDPVVRNAVERYDWYIFPVTNPDGFVYTKTTNRMWRKTRVPYENNCYGADPNRNWDYRWNTVGASNNPCSETFAGPYAFSEPEVASMAEFISTVQSKMVAYLSFHSYSQLLLLPFGHTADHLDNYAELKEVGETGMEKLASFFGTLYRVGNTAEILYPAAGTSTDWVKGVYGTRITYTYELRDTGRYGFILPADQIIPSGIETFASVVTILDEFNKI